MHAGRAQNQIERVGVVGQSLFVREDLPRHIDLVVELEVGISVEHALGRIDSQQVIYLLRNWVRDGRVRVRVGVLARQGPGDLARVGAEVKDARKATFYVLFEKDGRMSVGRGKTGWKGGMDQG